MRRVDEGQPDLLALFNWLRFARPVVPAEYSDRALSDVNAVSDAALLQMFGDNLTAVN